MMIKYYELNYTNFSYKNPQVVICMMEKYLLRQKSIMINLLGVKQKTSDCEVFIKFPGLICCPKNFNHSHMRPWVIYFLVAEESM